jgi:transposase
VNGIGHHIAARLVRDGEQVVDVPAKLSERARAFISGRGRKTDAWDAPSAALVGVRMQGLHPVVNDEQIALLRVLVDRRRALGEDHTRMTSQLRQLLLELIPGGAKKDLSAAQAKVLLASVRPREAVGKARRRVAAELIADLEKIYQRSKAADKELTALLAASGTTLTDLHGIGPPAPPACWSRSATSPGSRPRRTSPPGTAPPHSTPPSGTRSGTGSAGKATGRSTASFTSWPSTNYAPTPSAAPTTTDGRRKQDLDGSRPSTKTAPVRRDLPPDGPRRPTSWDAPGRANSQRLRLQRDRPQPNAGSSDKPLPGPLTSHTRTTALAAS